jgi:hypothetical protein
VRAFFVDGVTRIFSVGCSPEFGICFQSSVSWSFVSVFGRLVSFWLGWLNFGVTVFLALPSLMAFWAFWTI